MSEIVEKMGKRLYAPNKKDVLFDLVRNAYVQLLNKPTHSQCSFRDLQTGKTFDYDSERIVFYKLSPALAQYVLPGVCRPNADELEHVLFSGLVMPVDVAARLARYTPNSLGDWKDE
ncbi:hypothetical protein KY311_04745 [Candidatus Woesearchaeota archaeon]|nr:hypothetical protein [Candidatus Woesearchaeota archaeon]